MGNPKNPYLPERNAPTATFDPSAISVVKGIATNDGIGVYGESDSGIGVLGRSTGAGVEGDSTSRQGVIGSSVSYRGVEGTSETGYGVWAQSQKGIGVYATGNGGAAQFVGTVWVNGLLDVQGEVKVTSTATFAQDVAVWGTLTATTDIVLGADCAEEFDVAGTEEPEPGTVMVLNEEGPLQPSQQAYDKKVAGVISGAGDYQPGLILDRRASTARRLPVALVGKVYCKVDAQYAPIAVGDLLTTSPTPGHAMKAVDPVRAFGAVIGKALRSLEAGHGLIPVLIALQ